MYKLLNEKNEEIICEKALNRFVEHVLRYLYEEDQLKAFMKNTAHNGNRYTVHIPCISLCGIFTTTYPNDTSHWFQNPFNINGTHYYLSVDWCHNKSKKHPLNFPDFKEFVECCYNGKYHVIDTLTFPTISNGSINKGRLSLKRTFHAVGQGAFYSERFYEGEENVFNVVYDCGSEQGEKRLKTEIDDFAGKGPKPKIDLLFISHFHKDHVNGISNLLNKCDVENIIIPYISTELLIENYIYNIYESKNVKNLANEFLIRCAHGEVGNSHIISISSDSPDMQNKEHQNINYNELYEHRKLKNYSIRYENLWEYIPFNSSYQQNPYCPINPSCSICLFLLDFMEKYKELYEFFKNKDFHSITEYFKVEEHITAISVFYKSYFTNLNETSMAVISKPISLDKQDEKCCLFTGDYPFRNLDMEKSLKKYYSSQWDLIGTLQVPHHGSGNDNPSSLHDTKRTCVVSYATGNRYRHPSPTTERVVGNSKSTIHKVTQDSMSKYIQTLSV